jgi:flagellar biosynthesis protein FlhB
LFLPQRKRAYGVFIMGIGQFGQGTVTNVVGLTALTWFLYTYLQLNALVMVCFTLVAIAVGLFLLTCYFNIKWLVSLLGRVSFLKKYSRFFAVISQYSLSQLIKVFLFCIVRFSVFSFQYYLVIHLLLPGLPAFPAMMMVFNNFFIQSALPTLDVIDVGLRGLTASTFFGYITNQQIAVIAAVSSIWFINLIIPAILGSVFVLKINFFDRNS